MGLIERRSEFVFDAARLAAIAAKAPIVPKMFADREQDFRDQFFEVIERQCGENRSESPEELTRRLDASLHRQRMDLWRSI